jgi:fucose permease
MGIVTKIKHYPKIGLILLAYIAFISLGMPDGLVGVAWPSMRHDFSIPLDALGMLMFTGMLGYMTSSFLSGTLIARLGVGRLLAVSCAMTGSVLIGYTLVPSWWMMVLLGTVAGLGAGAIDAGLNTYVASHFGEGVMQWLHACWGIGITMGPIIMTFTLTQFSSWRAGYVIVGVFQLLLAIGFTLTLPMWDGKAASARLDEPKNMIDYRTPIGETLRQPRVWLSASLFLIYCGVEGALGVWTYSLLTESRGIAPAAAGLWAGSYWGTFTVGRIIAGLFAKRVGVDALLHGSLAGGILGGLLLWWNPFPLASLIAVAVIGFSIAPVFPALVSGTERRVGAKYAANTIGLQMVATGMGSAGVSALVGVLAQRTSLEAIPVCVLVLFVLELGLYRLAMRKAEV